MERSAEEDELKGDPRTRALMRVHNALQVQLRTHRKTQHNAAAASHTPLGGRHASTEHGTQWVEGKSGGAVDEALPSHL